MPRKAKPCVPEPVKLKEQRDGRWRLTVKIGPLYINDWVYDPETRKLVPPWTRSKGRRWNIVQATGGLHMNKLKEKIEAALAGDESKEANEGKGDQDEQLSGTEGDGEGSDFEGSDDAAAY